MLILSPASLPRPIPNVDEYDDVYPCTRRFSLGLRQVMMNNDINDAVVIDDEDDDDIEVDDDNDIDDDGDDGVAKRFGAEGECRAWPSAAALSCNLPATLSHVGKTKLNVPLILSPW